MEADAKYTYVGLAVIALLAAVVAGIVWLKHTGSRSDYNYYTIYFERQPLDGLQIGADVSMRGIKVGRVEDYALTDNINRVRVLIRIDRRTPVSTNTVAVVNRRFVTGIAKIDLETSDPPGPPLIALALNETYPIIPEGTSNLDAIANRLNRVGETAAETLERLNDVLKPENRAAIEKTLANLRDLTGGLNQRLAELDRTLKAVEVAANGVGRASNSVADFADSASQDLRPAIRQAELTMKDISAATIALEKQAAYLAQSVGSTVDSSGDQLTAVSSNSATERR
jgi:phospholipid/cholesterol/gamma-HCH transport system substrate-binding protein